MTTTAPATQSTAHEEEAGLDIEALYPADPELMASPEGDKRGLQELQSAARERRSELRER